LLHLEVAAAMAVESRLESVVGLEIGAGGWGRLLEGARERRLGIGDRDDVQGGAGQPGELDCSG
jgi:hypothetical protein